MSCFWICTILSPQTTTKVKEHLFPSCICALKAFELVVSDTLVPEYVWGGGAPEVPRVMMLKWINVLGNGLWSNFSVNKCSANRGYCNGFGFKASCSDGLSLGGEHKLSTRTPELT